MSNSTGSSAGNGSSKTSIIAEMVTESNVLEVNGYSKTKGLGVGKRINSGVFTVAGHRWFISYYPDGHDKENASNISIYLRIDHPEPDGVVTARFGFSLLNHSGEPVPKYTFKSLLKTFLTTTPAWGYHRFIKRKKLESSSSYLKNDSFQVRCDLTAVQVNGNEPRPTPLLDLQRHLGDLLESKVGGDVTFELDDGEVFTAHRYVLAARSSVFMAELFGPMKATKATDHIRIHDMEARVFKSMLYFIYTDSMPVIDECDKKLMAQHLLVAADRYNLQRLKLICEDMLSSVDVSIAATTLVIAEQHGCQGLKDACLEFLKSPGNLKAVMASDGFQHLKNSCPSLLEELLAMFAP